MEKKSKNVILTILGALVLLELIMVIISVPNMDTLISSCHIVSLAFVVLYGFCLYRIPHSNMLKYAMLTTAAANVLVIVEALLDTGYSDPYLCLTRLFAMGVLVYISGRLNRIDQNKYLLPVVVIAELANSIIVCIDFIGKVPVISLFTFFTEPVSVAALMLAYFVRYKEHKEAGISDK